MVYIFEDYALDLRHYELRYAGKLVKLEPQVFDVLIYLIQHRDRVVTKEELLAHVWPGRIVSETTLTSRLMAARRAAGDRGREQRVIQTLHGRGYRFVAPVEEHPDDVPAPRQAMPAPQMDVLIERLQAATPEHLSPQPSPGPSDRRQEGSVGISQEEVLPSLFTPSAVGPVGRQAELAQLHGWLQQALDGTRQVIFVTGEMGLGKTTLVEAFLNDIEACGGLWVGRGQCLEHYGAGEAYMPILDALGRLCREPGGQELLAFLVRRAPTWMVQMPWLMDDAMLDMLQPRVMGATRERMLREMAEAVEVLTAERPLVLILEDLHWSDASTLDLIVSLESRPALGIDK